MAEVFWDYPMDDGYIASTDETTTQEFNFSLDYKDEPCNTSVWRRNENKNDGYPFITDFTYSGEYTGCVVIDTLENLIKFSNGEFGRGTSSEYLNVVLVNDLDFNDLKEFDNPYNWAGCTGTWYVNFDGQGHKIDNIYYMGSANWGFFDDVYGSSIIKNLKLTNLYVTGSNIGGIARVARGTTIENCDVSGQISGVTGSGTGGIVGGASTVTVSHCSFSGTIQNTGGGYTSGILPQDGGLVCYSSIVIANMSGRNYVFGFAGDRQTLINCEFRGSLSGPGGAVSSLAGKSSSSTNCIAAITSLTGSWYNHGSLYNCYFDSTLATAGGFSLPGTGATTEELHSLSWLREHNFPI